MRRTRCTLIAVLVWLGTLAWPAQAQTPTITLESYEQLVRESYAAASRSDRIGLDDASARIVAASTVTLPDGTPISVDNRWLAVALAQEPPDYPVITARLGAILDALGQARTGADPDALTKLDDVFAQPPFRSREAPGAWTRFWSAVGQAIGDFLDRLFRSLPQSNAPVSAPPSGFQSLSPLGWTLLIAGVALILGIVLYAIRGVRSSLVRDAQALAEADDEATLTASEALDRAQSTARDGDYRAGVRYLYLSSLLWLDERKLLRYDRSLTNREYLARARANQSLHDRLQPVVSTFERSWYGKQPLDASDFESYEQQIAELQRLEQRP